MLASISPVGERARGARWARTMTSYVVSSTTAGAALGAALGAVGSPLPHLSRTVTLVVAATAAAAALVADVRRRVPTIRRQVDESWLLRYRDWVYGLGFGAQLGFGGVTIVTSASSYLTWVLELVAGSAWAGAGIGAAFGLARALPLLAFARVHDATRLRARHRSLERLLPQAHRTVLTAQGLAVVGLVAGLVSGGKLG